MYLLTHFLINFRLMYLTTLEEILFIFLLLHFELFPKHLLVIKHNLQDIKLFSYCLPFYRLIIINVVILWPECKIFYVCLHLLLMLLLLVLVNLVCRSEPESLPRNSPDWIILDNWVFDRSISVDEMLAKAWRRFGTCLLVYKNLLQSLIY